jgi:hypoxanthine phosphoribosyltransferase
MSPFAQSCEARVKPLLSEQQLQEGISRMAAQIAAHYRGKPLTIVGVLTGSLVCLADLIRRLDFPLQVGLLQARSYRGEATSAGELTINPDLFPEVRGRDVLLLDDIFDTGHTLARLVEQLRTMGPASLRTAVLLRKLGRQEVSLQPDFVGFEIPNAFVVGYGLDYNDQYRNLPYVAVLDDEEAKGH